MNTENTLEKEDEGKVEKPVTRGERLLAIIGSVILIGPMVFSITTLLFATPFNKIFNYEKECTISEAAAGSSGSKSYSSSYYIYVKSPDCEGMRYYGPRNGLNHDEVADRIDLLEGQTVTVDVGYWQFPFSDTFIVGIEGLDLSQ
ncbi:hypothetical protein [Rothia nasimurium]|uniref:hypothetical protein n=1 Tax=Rothia nasimurium TaxID=85336 RepID=UPI001F2AF32C|nr:hypothetical protein [Rothia nasimurium]